MLDFFADIFSFFVTGFGEFDGIGAGGAVGASGAVGVGGAVGAGGAVGIIILFLLSLPTIGFDVTFFCSSS